MGKSMRIIVNGQQAFGRAVLDALVERGENVVGVYTAPDGQRGPDPLKTGAIEHGLPVFQPRSFRRESVCQEMRELAPDLAVMAYVTLFVPRQVLDVPKHGTIQYHPSLLPLHKGPSAINWPIIFNEKRTGLTIFWPDEGLDTGPVLLRKEVEIGADDTLGSLYFERLFPMGVAAMLEAIDLVRDGKAPKTPQTNLLDAETQAAMRRVQSHADISDSTQTVGTYESWCRAEQAEIDWRKPAQDVYNLIRGCNPQPGAWTLHGGEKLQLFDSRLLADAPADGDVGEVVALSNDGFVVRAGTGGVAISRVRPTGSAKMAASEFAAKVGLDVGYRFG